MNKTLPYSYFSEFDIYLFKEGRHYKLYEKFGAHPLKKSQIKGTYFSVWAPSADRVEVVGDFNYWDGSESALFVRWDSSGIWEGIIPEAAVGQRYKFRIYNNGKVMDKADPYARFNEHPPETASIIWDIDHKWKDDKWMKQRKEKDHYHAPMSVYEVHLGSWKKDMDNGRPLDYHRLADELAEYLNYMGYTHVELMPIMEHPYEPSWGYQVTGYFAPSSRFGDPQGFKYFVETMHNHGIGVLLDWVPAHFPSDEFALANFDGSHLYEHPDPRRGYHPDWKSLIFNYGRNEVKSFLISNAIFWLEQYHADGLRVDAVASMLYLDYSRNHGEWEANEFGGNENLEAIAFIKEFNEAVYAQFPSVLTIAEESTNFPMVSKPTFMGGLGFAQKWMMGWMNDTLNYFSKDPIYRQYHQNDITFSLNYAFSENFMLPLSHDEVVHGKQSLLYKMPGDEWQKHANFRTLMGYMFTHPGTKLLFMGDDFAQSGEWNFNESIDWRLLDYKPHRGGLNLVRDLNHLYTKEEGLHHFNFEGQGFEWIDIADNTNSIISFLRKSENKEDTILVVANFTPTPHQNYRLGCPDSKEWKILLNTDDDEYFGSNFPIRDVLKTEQKPMHGREFSVNCNIPPLSVIIYKIEC